MADLKYFIMESQRFRAGADNVEEGGTVVVVGGVHCVHLSRLVLQQAKRYSPKIKTRK